MQYVLAALVVMAIIIGLLIWALVGSAKGSVKGKLIAEQLTNANKKVRKALARLRRPRGSREQWVSEDESD